MKTLYDQQQPVQRWVAVFSATFGIISIAISIAAIVLRLLFEHKYAHDGNGYWLIGANAGMFAILLAAFVPAVVGLCLAGGAAFIGAVNSTNKFRWPKAAIWINAAAFVTTLIVVLLILRGKF